MTARRVFLDVGSHLGESLVVAMEPQWRFDRIWAFEPTATCIPALEGMSDERVEIVRAGLWSSDTQMTIHDPGTLHASVDPAASHHGRTEVCQFLDASHWFRDHIMPGDRVWMKVNIEGAEIDVLGRLIESGQIQKVDFLVVHFDAEKHGRHAEAALIRERLNSSGVNWREAREVMFGRTDSAKVRTWLAWTESQRTYWWRQRAEHTARRWVFQVRTRLRLL